MTKNIKKVLCVIMALLMICLGSFSVFAQKTDSREPEINPARYAVISEKKCSLNISGINATMTAVLKTKTSASLKIVMELQKVKSGIYETIETYTETGTGYYLDMEKTRLMNAFATYRLCVTFTAGSETVVAYSYP